MTKLISEVSDSEVKELVKAHNELQLGCYFSSIEKCLTGSLSTSDFIGDFFWNLLSGFEESNVSTLISESKSCFEKKGRVPSFYIDPTCKPLNLIESLESEGFLIEREVWMSPSEKINRPGISTNIDLEIVNEASMDDFLKVFSLAFGGESTEKDGYGDIPPSYLDALRYSVLKGSTDLVSQVHFLAKINSKPVGCGSIHINNDFAGLYNIGTLPEERKKGIGRVISLHAMYYAETTNVKRIFLQTQPNGSVQKFYEGLDCKVIFESAIAYTE